MTPALDIVVTKAIGLGITEPINNFFCSFSVSSSGEKLNSLSIHFYLPFRQTYFYCLDSYYLACVVSKGRICASIYSRFGSRNGGSARLSPSVSYGSSPIKPGPSVDNSIKI